MSTTERMKELRDSLVDYLEFKAEFREEKCDEAPWTAGKNLSYDKSIQRVAEFVSKLPLDDSTLIEMEKVCWNPYSEIHEIPECVRECADSEAIHFGPRGAKIKKSDCEQEFREWAEMIIDGVRECVAEANKIEPGTKVQIGRGYSSYTATVREVLEDEHGCVLLDVGDSLMAIVPLQLVEEI